jgi:hypothetical protein
MYLLGCDLWNMVFSLDVSSLGGTLDTAWVGTTLTQHFLSRYPGYLLGGYGI